MTTNVINPSTTRSGLAPLLLTEWKQTRKTLHLCAQISLLEIPGD